MRRLIPVLLTAVLVACVDHGTSSSGASVQPPGGSVAATGEPQRCEASTNALDHAVCPRLHAAGCSAAPVAPTFELCRRMYLDLTGVVPSPEELAATCEGKTPREIATALMDTPDFVEHAQELWGETLGYEPAQVDGKWLADADAVVALLMKGELGYDAFAKRLLGSPLFAVGARLPRSDVLVDEDRFFPQAARRAIKVFLGRDPIAFEDVALGKLFSPWKKTIKILNGDYGRAEPFLDPTACPCNTSVFGVSTELHIPLDAPTTWDDLAPNVSPELRAELDKVGALFVAQDPFWAQGTDLALGMYLGWWKSTQALDQSLLPEVELALGERLRKDPRHSFRDLVLEIVTSALYTRSNAVLGKAPVDYPVYCTGPLRMQRPEAYVSSLGKLLGLFVGRCDHRTYEARGNFYADGSEGSFFPDALRSDVASDVVTLGVPDYHYVAASGMGGCSGGAARSEEPTMQMVFGASPVASALCEKSQLLLPAGTSGSDTSAAAVSATVAHVFVRMIGRVPTPTERAAVEKDVAACGASSPCGAQTVSANVCSALARSTDFATY